MASQIISPENMTQRAEPVTTSAPAAANRAPVDATEEKKPARRKVVSELDASLAR